MTETFNAPKLLAELGLSYVLDGTNDDQPYPLIVPPCRRARARGEPHRFWTGQTHEPL